MGQIYYTNVCNVANKVNIFTKIYSIYGKLHPEGHLYVQGNISLNILNLKVVKLYFFPGGELSYLMSFI